MVKYMKRKRPKEPEHSEVFGKDRLSYGDPKEFGRRIVDEEE